MKINKLSCLTPFSMLVFGVCSYAAKSSMLAVHFSYVTAIFFVCSYSMNFMGIFVAAFSNTILNFVILLLNPDHNMCMGTLSAWIVMNFAVFSLSKCIEKDYTTINSIYYKKTSKEREYNKKLIEAVEVMRSEILSITQGIVRSKLIKQISAMNINIRNVDMNDNIEKEEVISKGEKLAIELSKRINKNIKKS